MSSSRSSTAGPFVPSRELAHQVAMNSRIRFDSRGVRSLRWYSLPTTIALAFLLTACGARTGLITGPPPDTRITEVCQSGFCLTQPFCLANAGLANDAICVESTGSNPLDRTDCTVAPPGGQSFCALHGGTTSSTTQIWAPNGAPMTIECITPPGLSPCAGFLGTVFATGPVLPRIPALDSCLFGQTAWNDFYQPVVGMVGTPWQTGGSGVVYPNCPQYGSSLCPAPSGRAFPWSTRTQYCGGTSSDSMSYLCNFNPPVIAPGTSYSQLGNFTCPKTGPLLARPSFYVHGSDSNTSVASANGGAPGGAYCNMLGDESLLGALPSAEPDTGIPHFVAVYS